MKAVLQRVKKASVSIEGAVCGEIGQGLMILLGVGAGDTEQDALRDVCPANEKGSAPCCYG